jgi:hypothetical protein
LLGFRLLLVVVLALPAAAYSASRVQAALVPAEMRSTAFTVTVNGQSVDVAHAEESYEFVSFDITGGVDVAITAAEPGFWNRGVDIQPWRLGLRPVRQGQTIRFRLAGPAKLSISRPGDFLNNAKMLFVFAGTPTPPPPSGPHVLVVPAGIHRQSLNPKSGDTIYLAPGAFIFGSLNLWNIENVKVLGRGTIVYEGWQDPTTDEGWMQKPDWHCISALNAKNVEIDGLTCIVRARTWSIQMKDTSGFVYDDLRVIGGNPGNANQDGMDWLGGGDATVRDSFLRTSDDVFAMQGNWDGRPSTRATLPCATPTFCTGASAPAARPSACSDSGAQTTPKATTPITPLRTYSSITGIRWCRWSRKSRHCTDSRFAISGRWTSRRWPLPRSPGRWRA